MDVSNENQPSTESTEEPSAEEDFEKPPNSPTMQLLFGLDSVSARFMIF